MCAPTQREAPGLLPGACGPSEHVPGRRALRSVLPTGAWEPGGGGAVLTPSVRCRAGRSVLLCAARAQRCLSPQFYRPLNIRVVLVGVEVWNDIDKCPVSQDPFASLHEFLDWRKETLLPRKSHDNAQLVR